MSSTEPQVGGAPPQIRVAGVLVGLQGLAALGVAVVILIRAMGGAAISGFSLGQSGFFAVVGAAVLAAGVGLVGGRRGARTPAIVTQLLLLPVVYSLLGPSRQVPLGVLAGAYVLTTFLLLISERSRAWSMDLAPEDLGNGPQPPPATRS